MLIGISGKKRSGKDTVAQILSEHLENPSVLHFADALKLEVAKATGFSIRYIEEHKENFRLILQGWGTDFRRKIYGDDYWLKEMDKTIGELEFYDMKSVIIADVRFENEYDYIKSRDGIVIRVERSVDYSDCHVSETNLDNKEFDHKILNFGSEIELREKVTKLVEDIKREAVNQVV